MRILLVVHGFPPAAEGGSEIYAEAHARVLSRVHGDDVVVLTRESDPDSPDYRVRMEQRDGLRIAWVNNTFRRTRSFADTYRNRDIDAVAAQLIDQVKPDVAHVHHLTCLSTGIVGELARRHIPLFLTLHDYWLLCHRGQLLDRHGRVCGGPAVAACLQCVGPAAGIGTGGFLAASLVRAAERSLPAAAARRLRRATRKIGTLVARDDQAERASRERLGHMRAVMADVAHFFSPSRHLRERFIEFGVAPGRISLAPYGVERSVEGGASAPPAVPDLKVRPPSARTLSIGFLGSLMVSKAPHVLLEAVSRLPRGAASVHLFGGYAAYHGDDSYRPRLESLLAQDGVHAHGAVPHDRTPEALRSIDLLAVPSIWPENSPLVIREAFLAGVPVVASRIGGIPEAVREGIDGLLFTAGDVDDLHRVLTRFLHEPDLLPGLRRGIPAVRTIEDDVAFTRGIYVSNAAAISPLPSLSAVVLNYRAPDDTYLAVKSLAASQRVVDDIVVVDNDLTEDCRVALRDVPGQVAYLRTGKNLGFSGGMNAGIRRALGLGASRILLVNSDVIVPPDCLGHLERALDATPGAGIAGPVVLDRAEPDRVTSLGLSYAPLHGRMRQISAGAEFASLDVPAHTTVDAVSGCLVLIKREVFDAVGLFDEEYFFSFEDLDLCLAARRAGFVTVLAGRAVVYHEGSRSIGAGSPKRLYYAARNHLRLARRLDPGSTRAASLRRASSIVTLNLLHAAARSRGASLPARVAAVARGTRDYINGRFGEL